MVSFATENTSDRQSKQETFWNVRQLQSRRPEVSATASRAFQQFAASSQFECNRTDWAE